MILTLQLRHDPALDAAPAAWFLPGDSAARWLEELARCGLGGMESRLFIVRRSIQDPTPAGLLVVPSRADSVSEAPAGMACRLIGGSFFVPADAVLYPPVAESELRRLAVTALTFFHPVFGLSRLEPALHVTDLIETPIETSSNWNFARPGVSALPELSAVMLIQPPSLKDMFGGAEEEIGTEPLENLPPAPDEPADTTLGKSSREIRQFFAKGLSEFMRRVPHTGRRRTWLNDVEDWANKQLRSVGGEIEKLRNKELNRLLHLLDSDPEAGLRQAIPMNSFPHRGTTPPGARLGSHSLDFDPSRMGGRPADFWNVPLNLQETLRRRYREMADREMQLGRHRRAAYIYAHLLGDLVSAANAFKQGRLFREAALLYEEHLRNPLEAARCLAEGGLLAEAIERYEKLGCWLEVADLQERAGNQAAAEAAIYRLVNERVASHDILNAAKLIEERLRHPEKALQMLLGAWPSSHQAVSCLGAAFQMLGRLGKHEVALERLAQFRSEPIPELLALPLLSVLGAAARDYPHERARHAAADLSRVLIARRLQRPGPLLEEAGRLLEHLVQLAPQDRLLSRDTNRYLIDRRNAERRTIRIVPPPVPGNKPVEARRFDLPRQIQWVELRRELHWFFALGVTRKRITLLRGVWEGEYQSLSWDCPAETVQHGFVFEPTAERGKAVVLARPGGEPLAQKRFPASDLFFNLACAAGTPSWLPTQGHAFAVGEDAVWSVHLAAGRAVLSCYDKVHGRLQRTLDITDSLLSNAVRTDETKLCLAAVENTVAIALGNRLLWTNGEGLVTRVELPGQAVCLCATIPNTRRGAVVMMHHGAVMYWAGTDTYVELDRDMASPLAAFVPGGPLILASGPRLVILDVDSRGVRLSTKMDVTGQKIVGVSATSNTGEFAVLNDCGVIIVYRIGR